MHLLEPPAAADQLVGEPVKQFRMAGPRALRAEIVLRLHQSDSEMVLPQAVDQYPAGQRVLAVGQPARQVEAGGT